MSQAIAIVKGMFGNEKIKAAFKNEEDIINRESAFAIQAMQANSYLAGIAMSNKDSLIKAILNIALTGVTLNPVMKHAYLVPRKKAVCLDFSARGLSHMAINAGAVKDITTQLVYEFDEYSLEQGSNPRVKHSVKFGDRGKIIGAYSSALLATATYHIEAMSIGEIEAIMRRSDAYKSGKSCPWKTDFGEMARKTVIKRLFKYLPIPSEVMAAVQIDHETNPALAVEPEQKGLDLGEDLILER